MYSPRNLDVLGQTCLLRELHDARGVFPAGARAVSAHGARVQRHHAVVGLDAAEERRRRRRRVWHLVVHVVRLKHRQLGRQGDRSSPRQSVQNSSD